MCEVCLTEISFPRRKFCSDKCANKASRKRNAYKHLESNAHYTRTYDAEYRCKLIELYGGKCIRCGFDDVRALQLDHINGGGVREAREVGQRHIYRRLVHTPDFLNYQLLCANCNWIKRAENNETPRKYEVNKLG